MSSEIVPFSVFTRFFDEEDRKVLAFDSGNEVAETVPWWMKTLVHNDHR